MCDNLGKTSIDFFFYSVDFPLYQKNISYSCRVIRKLYDIYKSIQFFGFCSFATNRYFSSRERATFSCEDASYSSRCLAKEWRFQTSKKQKGEFLCCFYVKERSYPEGKHSYFPFFRVERKRKY